MYRNIISFRRFMAFFLSGLFFMFSLAMAAHALQEFWNGIFNADNITGAFLNAINPAVIALATFELGGVVSKEYGGEQKDHIVIVLRRTVPRFVSMTCIALALEGLLLVIKYSQLELAGNLYYPVAIVAAASLLLIALGVFLHYSTVPETSKKTVADLPQYDTSCVPASHNLRTNIEYTHILNDQGK
jgi:hypothetical protein